MKKRIMLILILILAVNLGISCEVNDQRPTVYPTLPADTETVRPTVPESTRSQVIIPQAVETEPTLTQDTNPKEIVQGMIDRVNQERALADLRRITGVDEICIRKGCRTITGRETGSEGLQWAKDYIYEELVNLGYDVVIQDWSSGDYADQNLIVRKQGAIYPDEEILFIAHLDGYHDTNPAADDNASGAVALLELARVLSGQPVNRTVVIVFSSGEEHGSLGSRSYVDKLAPDQLSAIRYVVNVDSVGYDSDDDRGMQLWSGDQPTDFVQSLSDVIGTFQIDLKPAIVTGCN